MAINFKFKVDTIGNKAIGIVYRNSQMNMRLFNLLNNNAHRAIMEFNGELDWCENYVHFTHNGVNYKQIKTDKSCDGCCFCKCICKHPYFTTKPNCTDRIYVIDK